MQVKILQENLKVVLPMLQKALPSKPQLPVLSSILIIAEKGMVEFFATDLYIGVRAKIKADVIEDGKVIVAGEVFRELVSSLSNGEISFITKDNVLLIENNKSKTSLQIQSTEEYPEFPDVKGQEFKIDGESLKNIDKHVVFATSSDQSRPVLTAVLFNFSPEGLELVSTDGYRLSTLFLNDLKSQNEYQILIPAKAIKEVLRIATQQLTKKVLVVVSEELKQVLFEIDEVKIFIRLIEGAYPPYEKIIPPDFKYEYEMDGEELLSQVKRAQIFAKSSSNIVRISFKEEKILIKAISPSVGEYSGEISIKNNNPKDMNESEIAFNALYLIDFLTTVKPSRIWFGMNESLKPAMFKDVENPSFKYVVMPFRVNN